MTEHSNWVWVACEFECTNEPWEQKMLIGRLCHASTDFGIRVFGSTLGLASAVWLMKAKTQFGRWHLKMTFRRIMKIAVNKVAMIEDFKPCVKKSRKYLHHSPYIMMNLKNNKNEVWNWIFIATWKIKPMSKLSWEFSNMCAESLLAGNKNILLLLLL